MNKNYQWVLLFTVITFFSIAYGQGCSQCRLLTEQGSELEETSSFGSNINSGILYLMALPYVILILFFRKRIVNLFKSLFNQK